MLLAVHPGSEETTAPRSPARALTGWDATLLIVLTAGIAYSNSFAVPFQFDDAVALTGNPAITGFHLDPRGRRILGDLSFAASYRLFGDRPLGYHVVNVAIHVANALLVFWLVRSLVRSYSMRRAAAGGRDTAIAVVAAVLFAVHPMQTQAVTYIVQRYASLAAGFFLLACCSYVRFRLASSARASFAWYALFLASSLAAFETKESALVLPLAILLLELVFFSATARRRLLFFSPFLLGAAAAAGLALASGLTLGRLDAATRLGTELPRYDYALTQLRVVATYLRLLVVPVGQNLDHDVSVSRSFLEPGVLLAAAAHAALLGGAALALARGRRKDPLWRLVGFGVLWFYVTLLVESSFIPIVDLMFEHRVYLPSVGILVAAAALLAGIPALSSRRAWGATVLALTLALMGLTLARNRVWRSDLALWTDAVSKSPNKARPLNNLGAALFARGDPGGAFALYERAIRADPWYVKAYFNVGEALQSLGQYAEAIPPYERFRRWEPGYPDTYRNLAECYERTGGLEAAAQLRAAYERISRENAGAPLPPSLR